MSPPPTVPPRPAPPKKVVAPKIMPPTGKLGVWKTVLIIDPDVDNRKRVAEILRGAAEAANVQSPAPGARNLAFHEADNGSAAWALVEVVKPDLVVGEILLEGLSGMQLLRRLRERYAKDAPAVIFVTSMSNEVDRYWALRNGANAYVIKPFDDEFLRTRAIKYFEDRDDGGLDLDSNWIAET